MERYFDAGSFRVYGPYITEYGNDTEKFKRDISVIKTFEKKIAQYALIKDRNGKFLQYKVDIEIGNGSVFSFAIKGGKYDLYFSDNKDGEPRTEISVFEYKALLSKVNRLEGQLKGAIEYSKSYSKEELEQINSTDRYFSKYDPSINPVRGSPHKQRDDLFEH